MFKSVLSLFEEQVARCPFSVAVQQNGTSISYNDLNRMANRVAWKLLRQGCEPNDVVAIILPRSIEFIIAILGAFKVGATYLPIDPAYPLARISYMLEDSGAKIVICDSGTEVNLSRDLSTVHLIRNSGGMWSTGLDEIPLVSISATDPAYIIYTSGSSGVPKGVVLLHAGIPNLIHSQRTRFKFHEFARQLQLSSTTFDASVSEIFLSLASGAVLVIVEAKNSSGLGLIEVLESSRVTHVTITPSVLNTLPLRKGLCLEMIVTAGEKCSLALAEKWAVHYPMVNAYGPTEATVCATISDLLVAGGDPPIGFPISNCNVFLLDPALKPVASGCPGEIYLSGIGLAKEYLNQPKLTAERFLEVPVNGNSIRMYRTGDLGRRRGDSALEFLGRIDDQIKLRGMRIEIGEVEKTLSKHSLVKDVVAAVRGDGASQRLCAWVTIRNRISFWPSLAEFFVYDLFIYNAMSAHVRRNAAYEREFSRVLVGKTVVEVGTGPEAILSRLAVACGARKVYAIELQEGVYLSAKRKIVDLGLENVITLIHGNSVDIMLPEAVDYCISEIVGSIGGAEGAGMVIQNAKRFLKDRSCVLPRRTITKIAGIFVDPVGVSFSPESVFYINEIFQQVGSAFDFRLCIKGVSYDDLITTDGVFEDISFSDEIQRDDKIVTKLHVRRSGTITGFVLWLSLFVGGDLSVDTLEDQASWLPVYFPCFDTIGKEVEVGDQIELRTERISSPEAQMVDYFITGRILRSNVEIHAFNYVSYHVSKCYRGNNFYASLFNHPAKECLPTSSELRAFVANALPSEFIPDSISIIDSIPLTPSGKVDRMSLKESTMNISERRLPSTDLEVKLTSAFGRYTLTADPGLDDNFFHCGGNSLLAISFLRESSGMLGREVSLPQFFRVPTVAGLISVAESGNRLGHP